MAKPVQARVGEAVLQEMGIRRYAHHIQLVFTERQSSIAGGTGFIACAESCEEWALPHGTQVVFAKGL